MDIFIRARQNNARNIHEKSFINFFLNTAFMGLLQKRQLTPFFLNQYHPIMMTFSTRSSPNHFRQGITAGIIAGALWGLVFLFPRLTPEFSPMSQMVLRYVCYGLFALALSFQTLPALIRTLSRHDWGMLVKLSLQANILYYLCLATGVKYGGIAPTTLIIGMLPVTIAVMGRNDAGSLSWRALYAPIGLIVGGIIFISWDLFSHTSETLTSTPIQRLFALLSATGALVLWTYAAVNNARYCAAVHRHPDHRVPDCTMATRSHLCHQHPGRFALVKVHPPRWCCDRIFVVLCGQYFVEQSQPIATDQPLWAIDYV